MALHVITQLLEQPPVTSAVLGAELCPKAMPPLGLHEGRTLSPFLLGGMGTGGTSSANSRLTRLSVNGRFTSFREDFCRFLSGHTTLAHAMVFCVCVGGVVFFFFSAEDILSRAELFVYRPL